MKLVQEAYEFCQLIRNTTKKVDNREPDSFKRTGKRLGVNTEKLIERYANEHDISYNQAQDVYEMAEFDSYITHEKSLTRLLPLGNKILDTTVGLPTGKWIAKLRESGILAPTIISTLSALIALSALVVAWYYHK